MKRKKVSDVATISDEAFALLLLDNGWEKWVDSHGREDGKTDVETKHTRGGRGKGGATKFTGWAKEGLERHNELMDLVEVDRKNNTAFEIEHLQSKRTSKRAGAVDGTEAEGEDNAAGARVCVRREAWSDDDGDEED